MTKISSAFNLENFEKAREARHEFSSLRCAVSKDRRDEFVRLIRSPVVERVDFLELNQIARNIISFNAVRCADAVLCGETDGIIDPHFGFDPNGQNALYEACYFFHPKMVKLLLKAGFSADDDRRAGSRPGVVTNLPLNVALDGLRSVFHLQSRDMSAAKLLNRIFPADARLECIRLLALNTSVFNQIFFDYAKKGFLVEVVAMLLAAGDNLMPLCISDGEDDFVFNSFKELSHFLQANIVCVTNDQVHVEWRETLKLLDIYDKIGNQLTTYSMLKENRPSIMEFATLLQDAGLDIKIGVHNLDYVNRSNILSFKPSVLQNINQPSIPTRHSYHTSRFRTMASKHAPMTPPMKVVNTSQSLDSRKFLGSLMRILPRVVRRV